MNNAAMRELLQQLLQEEVTVVFREEDARTIDIAHMCGYIEKSQPGLRHVSLRGASREEMIGITELGRQFVRERLPWRLQAAH